jgi:hypothetical protein
VGERPQRPSETVAIGVAKVRGPPRGGSVSARHRPLARVPRETTTRTHEPQGRPRFHVEQDLKVLTSGRGDARIVAVLRRIGVPA